MAQHLLGLELAHRPRQVIEIAQEMTGPGLSKLAVGRVIRDAGGGAPVSAFANMVSELEQGQLALEAHHAVELRDLGQSLSRTEARKVTAHGEMAVDPGGTQTLDERCVAADVKLKYQREADQERPFAASYFCDLLGRSLDVGDHNGVPELLQRGREIAQAEIALVEKANQQNGSRRVAPALPKIAWPITRRIRLRHAHSAAQE
jgi:hypothetical protein